MASIAYAFLFRGSLADVGFGILFLIFGGLMYLKRQLRGWDDTSFFHIFISFFGGTLFWVIGLAVASFTISMLLVGDISIMASGFLALAGHEGVTGQQRHPSQKWIFIFGFLIAGWGAIALGVLAVTGEFFLSHMGVAWIVCGGIVMVITAADRTLAIEMEWGDLAFVFMGGGLALLFGFVGINLILILFTISTIGYWVMAVWFDKGMERKAWEHRQSNAPMLGEKK